MMRQTSSVSFGAFLNLETSSGLLGDRETDLFGTFGDVDNETDLFGVFRSSAIRGQF
jgi:hypothetical protein